MNRRKRFLYEEWLLIILMWLVVFYLYYIIAVWGPMSFMREGALKDYLSSGYVHIEIILEALVFGLLFNLTNEIVNRSIIRKRSFGSVILIKSLFYVIALVITGFIVFFVFSGFKLKPFQNNTSITNMISWQFLVSALIFVVIAIVMINFLIQMNRKFGPGNLQRLLFGKYHRPRAEERIFLFIDLRDSTTIAEKLGHIDYSQFLRHCFDDLTNIVLNYRAEIYQFVGDEVILSWNVQMGLNTLNCIKTYFAYERALNKNKEYYLKTFGIMPEFRGGMDLGIVTVAEIGDIKREIAYHGDPLNTAARLREQCRKFNKQLLLSEHVKSRIESLNGFVLNEIGRLNLRGKIEAINVYSVEIKS